MFRTPVSELRLQVLEWLRDPVANFPPQPDGDLAEDGVTADAVAARLGVARAVADTHLGLLADLGLLRARSSRGRTYYRRDDIRAAEVARLFEKGW